MSWEHPWDNLEKVQKMFKKSSNLDQLTTLDQLSNLDLCPTSVRHKFEKFFKTGTCFFQEISSSKNEIVASMRIAAKF